MEILTADLRHKAGIRVLLRANHISTIAEEDKKDGFVTTHLTEEQLETLITREKGITVAVDQGGVVAFAMAAPWSFWKAWPMFLVMLDKLEKSYFDGKKLTEENTYQYGPICVAKAYRGKGVFEKVFFASLASMADRFPVMTTFINKINHRSYAAHVRKGHMTGIGTFDFNGNHYALMACRTHLGKEVTNGSRN
jgi:GNAT superfamily N-acetyltransferase